MFSAQRSTRLWLAGIGLLLAAAAICARQLNSWQRYEDKGDAVTIDWQHPDALIRSARLSRLPRDLLAVPLLKDLLDEDFVFYYEHNPDRLSLVGTLRRIAYEHELEWSDRLIAEVLDQPAELALWRDDKGALRRFALVLRRSLLTKALEQAATIALKDQQLKLAGTLPLAGTEVKVLSLEYANRRTLLIAAHDERLLVLSEPGMLLRAASIDEAAGKAVADLLTQPAGQSVFAEQVAGLQPLGDGHQIIVGANTLSFGYQHFFAGMEALRFDFDRQAWSTYLRIDPSRVPGAGLDTAELWAGLPSAPAACAALPIDWPRVQAALQEIRVPNLGEEAGLRATLTGMSSAAAVCWYRDGRFATPLFAARLSGAAQPRLHEDLQALFAWSASGESPQIERVQRKETVVWTREGQFPRHSSGAQGASTKVALALAGPYALFSPDTRLVERALASIERRHPNLQDKLAQAAPANTLATVHPKTLAAMAQQEAQDTLRDEPLLAQAVLQHLTPRLEKIAGYPPLALVAREIPRSGASAWVPIAWHALASE